MCDAVIACSKGVAKSLEAAFSFTDFAKYSTYKNERHSSKLPVHSTRNMDKNTKKHTDLGTLN